MNVTDEPTGETSAHPVDDDLVDDVAPRRRVARLTACLMLGVAAAAGFLAGVLVQKRHDRGLTNTAPVGAAAGGVRRDAFASGAGGADPGAGGFAGATVGRVKLIDGSTIYVIDLSGNTIAVGTTGASKFTKQNDASLKDVQPGDTVVVRGARQNDGSISAAVVNDNGPSGAGGN